MTIETSSNSTHGKSDMNVFSQLSTSSVNFIIKTIGRKYTFRILLELKRRGVLRNKDLLKTLKGISPSSFSRFLKQLESQQLILREVYDQTSPIRVFYSLSLRGETLLASLIPLLNWISEKTMLCADCNCTSEECKLSISPSNCPSCKNDVCCCWNYFHKE